MAKGGKGNKNISIVGGGKVSAPVKAKTYALFHGSPNANIEQFDLNMAGTNTSTGEKFLFFTDSKEVADDFSYERIPTDSFLFDRKGKKGKVYEVDVTLNHPLDFTNLTAKDKANLKKMSKDYIFGELSDKDIETYSTYNNQLFKTSIDLDKIKDYGYDGFIAKMDRQGHKEYAVLSEKQVKIKKK